MKYLHTLVPFDYLRLFLLAIFLVAGAAVCADAQGIFGEPPHEPYRYGGALLGGYANHSANFQTIPGYPNCCPQFTGGGGLSFVLAGQFERTIDDAPNLIK
ncbi:MAG: hypothetical protein JNL32_04355 [Candidatus Kapabacteria bacterium]|nr:hypothetical protein [Candidatus Kapabacteria bacterium]